MTTLGKFKGNVVGIFTDGTLVAYATATRIRFGNTIIDVTDNDDGNWASNLEGTKNWSMSVDGNFAMDATQGGVDYYDLLATGDSEHTAKWGNAIVGDVYWTGSVRIENLEINAPHNDKVTFTCALVGNGAPTKGTVTT